MSQITSSIKHQWPPLRDWLRDGRPLWWWIAIAGAILAVCYLAPVELVGIDATAAYRV